MAIPWLKGPGRTRAHEAPRATVKAGGEREDRGNTQQKNGTEIGGKVNSAQRLMCCLG